MASSQPVLLCRYGYDPLDRLISQLLPEAAAHQRFYCKNRLSTEIQGAIGYSIFQQDDLLLAQQKRQYNAVESTLLATDLQRSVLQALKADEQHPITYSPYGHRRAESGLNSLLGFNGERADPVSGCYPLGNGYRMFNPVLMRFNSPDSWSPFGEGGLNPYSYCLGDPINKNDSNGHAPFALKPVNQSSILTRRAEVKEIIQPNSGKLPFPPRVQLTNQRVLELSKEYLEVTNAFKRIGQIQNNLIKSDYEHYKNPTLKHIAANVVARNELRTDQLPRNLQSLANTPPVPHDAGYLLDVLNSAPKGSYNTLDYMISGNYEFLQSGSRLTSGASIKAYYKRIEHQIRELRTSTMNKHEKVMEELRGNKYL
ncbi:RHS repeat-associated core domain-containing protein [Pseudomonas sp. IT-P176]|uniref:RHS repeat-associated core domain-containing protein n=1 Tax=Pseudomonas sp. IT-P176 TaxID=3026444 RepID=UPI0039E0FAB1